MAEDYPVTPLDEPDPVRRPARLALYAGAGLLLAGLIALYLGYNGAATNAIPQAQTPFVISGGLFGLGLMTLGGIALALHVILQIQGDFRAELRVMREAVQSLNESLSRSLAAATPAMGAHTNGTVMVARDGSSFHRPGCRLVARTEHVRPFARAEANDAGLIPCRICKP